MRFRSLAAVLTFAGIALQAPLTVTLVYLPQDDALALARPLPPSVLDRPAEIRVEDARVLEDPLRVGEGNDGNRVYPVLAGHQPLPFLRETVVKIAGTVGLQNASGGTRTLKLRIVRFWVDQSHKTVGAMYTANVTIAFSFQDKSGGVMSEGSYGATASRYGKARSVANCNETLSDALKAAVFKVLDDEGLRESWKAS